MKAQHLLVKEQWFKRKKCHWLGHAILALQMA